VSAPASLRGPLVAIAHRLAMVGLASLATLGCLSGDRRDSPPAARDGCFIGGCSDEVCSDRSDVASPCIWRARYACYRDAICERQASGSCDWTASQALSACLAHAASTAAPPGLSAPDPAQR
jgi:hypothetical protein